MQARLENTCVCVHICTCRRYPEARKWPDMIRHAFDCRRASYMKTSLSTEVRAHVDSPVGRPLLAGRVALEKAG